MNFVTVLFVLMFRNPSLGIRIDSVLDTQDKLKNLNSCLYNVVRNLYEPDETIAFHNFNRSTWFSNIPNPVINIGNGDFRAFDAYYPYANFVMFVYDINQISYDMFVLKQSKLWNANSSPRGKYLIILSERANAASILRFLWSEDIYQTIVFQFKQEQSAFLSADPYNLRNYHESDLNFTVLGTCEDNEHVTFLEYAPSGLGRNLTFCCYEFKPPYMADVTSNRPGTTISALRLISKKMAMNLVLQNDSAVTNEFFMDGKSDKMQSLIYSKEIDLFSIPYYYAHHFEDYEVTSYYMYDTSIWIIPAPEEVSKIELLFTIFDAGSSALILAAIVFTILAVWLIAKYEKEKCFENVSKTAMDIYAATCSLSFRMLRIRSTAIKISLLSYFIFIMHVSSSFHGRYSSMLTKPTYKSGINTLEKLLESGRITPVLRWHQIALLNDTNLPLARKIAMKSKHYDEFGPANEWLKYVVDYKNICIVTYEYEYYLYDSSAIRKLENRYLESRTDSFGFRRGHPLMNKINNIVRAIFEAGFNNKWLSNMKNLYLARSHDQSEDNHLVFLTNKHLKGVYIVLLGGLTVGFGVFICEVIHSKFMPKP